MKTSIFAILVLSLFVMHASAEENPARPSKDNGRMCTEWLPDALLPIIGKQPTGLIAKYEPESGASYYVLLGGAGKNTRVSVKTYFFKVEGGKGALLGRDVNKFPFSEYVSNPEVVRFLWQDYLTRWIEQDGREGIQGKLNMRAHAQMTEEESFYLTHAGFKIPSSVKLVPNFLPEKPRPKK